MFKDKKILSSKQDLKQNWLNKSDASSFANKQKLGKCGACFACNNTKLRFGKGLRGV